MAVLGVTNTFSSGTAIVASQMNTNFDDIEAFVNTTPGVLQLTGGTVTGAVQLNNTLTLGSSGAGHDVVLWGDTAGDYFWYDADTNKLVLEGTNGTTVLDVSDGNVVIGDGTLTVSGDLVVDTNCLYVDVSENRVGINTASPVLTGLTIGRQPSDANEGGQINFEGGTSYSNNLSFDRYGNDLRFLYNGSVVGSWTSTGSIDIEDAGKLLLGTGDDLQIYANASHSFIDHDGDGNLYIRARGTDEDMYIDAKDNLNLQTDSATHLTITAGGVVTVNPSGTYPVVIGVGNRSTPNGANIAVGTGAMAAVTGANNVAIGINAMNATTTSGWNTAVGHGSMALQTTQSGAPNYAQYSTAVGFETMYNMINGSGGNVGVGYKAGRGITTGLNHVYIGMQSGDSGVSTGGYITAVGYNCARSISTGSVSTYMGASCATVATEGAHNVAMGYKAGVAMTTGGYNVIIGSNAGQTLTTASNCVIVGEGAGWYVTGVQNTFVGMRAGHQVTTSVNCTALGWHALYTASFTGGNTMCLGYNAQPSAADADNEVTVGDSNISAFRCQVDVTVLSDGRDKADIQDLDVGLDFVKRLRPRRWSWDMREEDGKHGIADAGFVAQELQQAQTDEGAVIPNLVYEKNPDRLESSKATLIPVLVKAVQELAEKVEAMA